MKVLLIGLEFSTWSRARSWTYSNQLGLEEGLQANGVEYMTVPAIHELSPSSPESWLYHLRDILDGNRFDQVWIEIVHTNLDETFLEWLATVAPVRIGIIAESLTYYPEEYAEAPNLRKRKALVDKRLSYLTHVLAPDEKDAEDINAGKMTRAMWWPAAVPGRNIYEQFNGITNSSAIFVGAIYGERAAWFEYPGLKGLLALALSPEHSTEYPELFDKLNMTYSTILKSGLHVNEAILTTYITLLRRIRQDIFALYMDCLRSGCAVVNLPHFVKTYAGRVVEGMAAGRPVISWDIPDRPRNKMLFESGREILLFPKADPSVLAFHIRRIQSDPAFAMRLVKNAREKIIKFHTVEKRVQQILKWVETGKEPDYGESKDSKVILPVLNNTELSHQTCPQKINPLSLTKKDFTLAPTEGITSRFPALVHFLLIDKCNAKCIMCGGDYFNSRTKRIVTIEKFKRMASNLKLERFRGIVLAGAGDPLLNHDLVKIIQFVNERFPNVGISVTTNGIALTEKLSNELLKCKIGNINVSINSASRAVYKRIMQVDCFDKVSDNIRRFVSLRNLKGSGPMVQFSSAINRLNIEDLPMLVELAKDIGVESINIMYCRFYPERIRHLNVNREENYLNDKDSLFYYQELSDQMVEKAKSLANNYGIRFSHEPLFKDNAGRRPCHWTETEIIAGFDGEVYPCGGGEIHFREKVEGGIYNFGNVLTESIETFWNGEMYRALRVSAKIEDPGPVPECKDCANRINPNDIRSHIMQWEEPEDAEKQGELTDRQDQQSNEQNCHSVDDQSQRDDYYNELFKNHPKWSSQEPNDDEMARWAKIASFLNNINESARFDNSRVLRMLEVGCGRGWLTNVASVYGSCEGVDPVAGVIESARKNFPHLSFSAGDAQDILKKPDFFPYDVVLTSEVIEHIPRSEQAKFVSDLSRLLKPGGHVILTTPRAEVFDVWMRITNNARQPVDDWLTESGLKDLFISHGFQCAGQDRIYVELPSLSYVLEPSEEQLNAGRLIPLYQVWAFKLEPKTTPLVSVIVPTHSRPEMLKETLRSILNQTYRNLEIIVVNDAGLEVENIVTGLNHEKNITYVRHGINRGLAASRNTGIRVATGKYIAYLDDDDIFYPNHLDTLVNFLENSDYKIAYSDSYRAQQVKEGEGYRIVNRDIPYSIDFNRDLLLAQNISPVLCFVHERSCVDEVGFFDETLTTHEDWDYWIRMSMKYDFAHIKDVTAEFRWRCDGSSMTSSRLPDFKRTMEIIYQRYKGYTKSNRQLVELQQRRMEWLNNEIKKDPNCIITSIIIVTYNSLSDIKLCFDSITANTALPYEIIVVDNASTDGSQELLKSLTVRKIILNKSNIGFSKACNQGIIEARGEYIVLLNPDTVVTQGWDINMVAHFQDKTGAVGPVSNYVAGLQKYENYIKENLSGEINVYELASKVYNWNKCKGIETKLLIGFCLMIKREVIDDVGMLDEDLFLGNEDLEYSLRLRNKGYRLIVATDTFIYHKGQSSFNSEPETKTKSLVLESAGILHRKLVKLYGEDKVPSSTELWGCEIFGLDSKGYIKNDPSSLLSKGQTVYESGNITEGMKFLNKRVAIIYDNIIRPDTTGEYCKRALSRLCEVTHFLPSDIDNIPEGFDLYLNVDDSLKYVLPALLRPSAWWVIDTHRQYDWDLKKAKTFNYIFAAQKDGAERLMADGITNVKWLPLACDPEVHRKHNVPRKYDISFVGNVFPGPREDLLNVIKKNFPNVFIGKKFHDEMAVVFSESKIVFNRSIKNDINMRIFEALSAGSLLVTNNLDNNGLSELFTDGRHLVAYKDEDELLRKIRYYMEHEDEREKIALEGMLEAQKSHTYEQRMDAILETCFVESRVSLRKDGRDTISIIILTYNQLEYTKMCIESIFEYTNEPFELIMVDNGSTDGTMEYLKSIVSFSPSLVRYKVIQNSENMGFARGCNQGIEDAAGEYILLLNNDVIVTEGWLKRMLSRLKQDSSAGIVGPCSNKVSGLQFEPDAVYSTMKEMHEFARGFGVQNSGRVLESARLVGFCMLIKMEVLDKTGLLDEMFSSGNFEDDDLCIRAQQAGYKCLIAQDVFVHHFGSMSFEGNGIDYYNHYEKNLRLFAGKWGLKNIEKRGQIEKLGIPVRFYADSYNILGERYFNDSVQEKAKELFGEATEIDPSYSTPYNNLGVIAWQEGDKDKAIQLFSQACNLNSKDEDAQANLASTLSGQTCVY